MNGVDSMAAVPWLTLLIAVPLASALLLWLVPQLHRYARHIGLVVSLLVLAGAVVAAVGAFDMGAAGTVQLNETYAWISQIGVSYAVGVNGLGLAMVLLAVFLVPLVLLAGWREQDQPAGYPGALGAERDPASAARRQAGFVALILALEALMIGIFAARDVFLFYVIFEAMLLPVYFLIGAYGGPRRKAAAMKFLLYSLAGGLIMLVGVVALYVMGPGGEQGFLIDSLAGSIQTGVWGERLLFLSFFIAFAIKAPLWPVHTWLPDTAEQSPPGNNVLLVGVLDKVGTFGMIALLLPLFPEAVEWAAPVIIVLALISIIYGAVLAIGQRDLMRLIAFTSVSHFGFIVLGIFLREPVALTGAMIYMVAHGISTAALFLVAGFLTQRTGSQRIGDHAGLQKVVPVLAAMFLVAGLASIALPGLSGFIPEYLVLVGTFRVNIVAGVIAVLGVILSALYLLLPYQRIFSGPTRVGQETVPDLGGRERWVMAPLVAAMLFLGIYPAPVLDAVRPVAEDIAIEQTTTFESAGDAATEEADQ